MLSIINQYGFWAILFLIAFENIFPPIPSEVILSFAGFLTLHSKLTLFQVVLAASIGSVLGAYVLYYIGYLLDENRLKKLVQTRLFRFLGFKADDVSKTITWFQKRGQGAVFYGRFVPIIRSLVSIPAGISKINFLRFSIFTFLGSLIWNLILTACGAYLGKKWHLLVTIVDDYAMICAGVIIIAFLYFAILWYKKRIKKEN
ncbi:alkaline phosphatase [Lactobacillus psittaci DSM 15354]|uniref:Alkaline phosphatase n=2 Tax=Lactobacillus psittaci TaxID=116089 RepID=A0A0R1SBX5_9LACO|nr:alkaline phosphatase [Lactobacillus psittaci DSM 15354]